MPSHPCASEHPMTRPIQRMVAGIATLQPDDPALTAALALSRRSGADLHLVHVDASDQTLGMPVSLSRSSALRGVVESAEPGATRTGRVVCRATTGDPERGLREAAAASGADLMVLGATRRGRLARAMLGTTATHLLRTTRIPILVVREPLPDRPLRVLLATDLSHHAAHAFEQGIDVARALDPACQPELRALFVNVPVLADAPLPLPVPMDTAAERELAEFVKAEVARMPVTRVVRDGDPAAEIVHDAREWEADLIVVGTHGRRGARRMFLGSVAETVLRNAPCATLVIPPLAVPLPDEAPAAGEQVSAGVG